MSLGSPPQDQEYTVLNGKIQVVDKCVTQNLHTGTFDSLKTIADTIVTNTLVTDSLLANSIQTQNTITGNLTTLELVVEPVNPEDPNSASTTVQDLIVKDSAVTDYILTLQSGSQATWESPPRALNGLVFLDDLSSIVASERNAGATFVLAPRDNLGELEFSNPGVAGHWKIAAFFKAPQFGIMEILFDFPTVNGFGLVVNDTSTVSTNHNSNYITFSANSLMNTTITIDILVSFVNNGTTPVGYVSSTFYAVSMGS